MVSRLNGALKIDNSVMSDQSQTNDNLPELSAEKGWTEIQIPDSYGNGRAFITGDNSSDRIKVKYFIKDDDQSFIGRVWFGPSTEGPTGFVHGGSMAAVLDEAMGAASWILGFTAVSAKITVRYRNLLPLNTVTTVVAKAIFVRGKTILTSGKIYDKAGTLFTESDGLFMKISPDRFTEMKKQSDAFQSFLHAKDPG